MSTLLEIMKANNIKFPKCAVYATQDDNKFLGFYTKRPIRRIGEWDSENYIGLSGFKLKELASDCRTAVVHVDDMKVDLSDNKLHGTGMPLSRVIMSEFSSWPGEWRRDWVFQDYDKEIRGTGGTSKVFAGKLSEYHRELGDDNPLKGEAPYMKTFSLEQFHKLNQLITDGYTLWFGGSNSPRHIPDGSSIEIVWSDDDVQTEDEVPCNRQWQWDLDNVNIIAYKIITWVEDEVEPEAEEAYIITKEQYQKLNGLINNLAGGEFSAAFALGGLMKDIEKQVK